MSVYDDPIAHIRALVRSVICISLEKDPQNKQLIGGDLQRNANKIPYPFLVSLIVWISLYGTE